MKAHRIFCFIATTACACLAFAASAAQPPQVVAPPVDESLHKSVFIDRQGFGRDPFFPNSVRRQHVVATQVVVPKGELPPGLVLNGLSGTAQQRLAILNSRTVAVGEDLELRLGGQLYKLRVTEIRERSVMVSANGSEPKELTLRSGL